MSDTEKDDPGKGASEMDGVSRQETPSDESKVTFRIVFEDDDDVEEATEADALSEPTDADSEETEGTEAAAGSDEAAEGDDGERATGEEAVTESSTVTTSVRPDSAHMDSAEAEGDATSLPTQSPSRDDEDAVATELVDHELRAERRRAPAEDDILLRSYPTFALHGATVVNRKTGRRPLDEVTLSFYAGTVYGVTVDDADPEQHQAFLGLASGLVRPAEGSVASRSADLLELDATETRGHRIGVVPQGFDLRDDMDAVDNIVYAMDASNRTFLKPKPALARELLDQVGFGRGESGDRATIDETAVSAGADPDSATAADLTTVPVRDLHPLDRRLASIARAISCEAEVLVLDEPTRGLDAEGVSTVLSVLADLAHGDPKRCVLVVTSDDDVLTRAEQVVELS
ncbi:ATP-binding cassette domain-containing protein [uncultured Bifidobacterium sp.]|uniref:ATP-binding cassette domain-containing protein n=1 Tax=uncultured Bifidobacterium sp. TaxID=165187 RepID=UPI0028DD18B1|nr:ATP-binding cassette domain-containing protein [uncultured Bifidobacterium sp.]